MEVISRKLLLEGHGSAHIDPKNIRMEGLSVQGSLAQAADRLGRIQWGWRRGCFQLQAPEMHHSILETYQFISEETIISLLSILLPVPTQLDSSQSYLVLVTSDPSHPWNTIRISHPSSTSIFFGLTPIHHS